MAIDQKIREFVTIPNSDVETSPDLTTHNLHEKTLSSLNTMGVTSLFEIQHKSFSFIRQGLDVVGKAKTGTGKTLAFALPILEQILETNPRKGPVAIIIGPTRELVKQIYDNFINITKDHKNIHTNCLYGGTPFGPQCRELRERPNHIVCATPGRLIDHIERGTICLDNVKHLCLDEADEMLSMGFADDIEKVVKNIRKNHEEKSFQFLLFSATLPNWVATMIKTYLNKPLFIDTVGHVENVTNQNISHLCISCPYFARGESLCDLVKVHAGSFGKTLIFTDTKAEANEIGSLQKLIDLGAGVLHGDIPQSTREVVMESFKSGKTKVLIATDVAARGLDVPNVDLVIQTHPPMDKDTYVHRSGRTARAGKKGTCVVFYTAKEESTLLVLSRKVGINFKRIGPPQGRDIVRSAYGDCLTLIDSIHQENVEAFMSKAKKLINERSEEVVINEETGETKMDCTALVASCLAAITGYTNAISTRSLLSCIEGFVAIQIQSDRPIESTNKAFYLFKNNCPNSEIPWSAKGMTLCADGYNAVFDLPAEHVDSVLQNPNVWKGVSFSKPKELPDLINGRSMQDAQRDYEEKRTNLRQKIAGSRKGGNSPYGKGKSGKGFKGGKGKGNGWY